MSTKTNLAARAARWSASHRKTAIFGWLAFVFVAIAIGSSVGMNQISDVDRLNGESKAAAAAIEDAGLTPPAGESILVQSKTHTAQDPAFRAAVTDVLSRVARAEHVEGARRGPVSADGHAALVQFDIAGDAETAEERVEASLAATAAAAKSHPGIEIAQMGDASLMHAFMDLWEDDLKKAETMSLPITLIILIVAFGALVAAGIPVLIAFSGVLATIGVTSIASHLIPMDENVASVIVLVGMAVGVDYSLFYLRRWREERAAGRDADAALEAAAATSGRAVLISGLTVVVAMAGMFFAGTAFFSSFAVGTILVVAISVLGSLTVLPAVLSKLGDRVEKGHVPFLRRGSGESRVWSAIVRSVMRRPVVALVAAGSVLIALSVPALSLHTAESGINEVQKDVPIVQTYADLKAAFPGESNQASVVATGDVSSAAAQDAIAELREQGAASGRIFEPVQVRHSQDGRTAEITFGMPGEMGQASAERSLAYVRETLVPQTIGAVEGVEVSVGGETAMTKDFNDLMSARMPIVFAFVLALAFVLMLVTFRSIVVPIKAIVLNLLSVGAAYGLLVLVFQEGLGESIIGFESTGAIAPWLPLFLFVILFGLSMDYHVFILSRIREAVDRGMRTEDAVEHGIRTTAGTVTSAAVVMVAVFAIFGTLSMLSMKQMGFGLAAAVLIDATIVRAVLLPAAMKLLGERNWYLPARLSWLPRFDHEPAVEGARA